MDLRASKWHVRTEKTLSTGLDQVEQAGRTSDSTPIPAAQEFTAHE